MRTRLKSIMNKKAMELSINFIVMLVLSIAVFSFGLVFLNNVFTQAGEIKAQLDSDSEQRLMTLLDRGEMVAIPIQSKDVKAGGSIVFGLGVLSIEEGTTRFTVAINCTLALSPNDDEIPGACSKTWFISPKPFDLTKNEKKLIPIAVQAPSGLPRGTYGFTVKVYANDILYGGAPKQFFVNIV